MKNATRLTLCYCFILLAFATPHAFSDEGEEQEPGSQEEVAAQEEQATQPPEGETEANEAPVTEQQQQEETEGLESVQGLMPQQINILLAPTACKPGYRVDHKGKCRPSL